MPNIVPDRQTRNDPPLHVAVGVIVDDVGRILIAKRPDHLHLGGLWEFPGGKVEAGESVNEALRRELAEELGIRTSHAEPLIKIGHRYPDRSVLLDVWRIDDFAGLAVGLEGQEVRWVEPAELKDYDFPAANRPIVNAAVLPCFYGILEGSDQTQVLDNLRLMLERGVRLIQLRLKAYETAVTEPLLQRIAAECRDFRVQLLLNSALSCNSGGVAQGIHLTSLDLMRCNQRPPGYRWVAASCHNLQELRQAEKIAVDFIVLAPVRKTRSHPSTEPLGWRQFAELTEQAKLPVFALGGVQLADLERARLAGAQGIAGISTFQAG
ncbi:Nudix family hydrolase [Methylomarinum vadi]|uniref:Nudix family hydrolase n=1 Tax=Methylomarinum vadi TaxID=438855 RepID=UPI00068E8106|nr:Nudix family hydrolase [Methylomarinum vadi]